MLKRGGAVVEVLAVREHVLEGPDAGRKARTDLGPLRSTINKALDGEEGSLHCSQNKTSSLRLS